MKLPNGELAVVDIQKLRAYCLNPHHPRGRHKARVFASVGIQESGVEELRTALLRAAREAEARPSIRNRMDSAISLISIWCVRTAL